MISDDNFHNIYESIEDILDPNAAFNIEVVGGGDARDTLDSATIPAGEEAMYGAGQSWHVTAGGDTFFQNICTESSFEGTQRPETCMQRGGGSTGCNATPDYGSLWDPDHRDSTQFPTPLWQGLRSSGPFQMRSNDEGSIGHSAESAPGASWQTDHRDSAQYQSSRPQGQGINALIPRETDEGGNTDYNAASIYDNSSQLRQWDPAQFMSFSAHGFSLEAQLQMEAGQGTTDSELIAADQSWSGADMLSSAESFDEGTFEQANNVPSDLAHLSHLERYQQG